ncbi:MAG: DNA-3-methyladenine glycosylase I [Holosporaceae bacterium]|jgi:DNA-3-methyladenine glycosylase I|nr:DNA-3-methyladenine glycosylase I [Holosporaceae bacterium]
MTNRCSWANSSKILRQYHDEEWGRPLHDDRALFEMLILEGMSCGLSWEIILKKREHMREVFDNFDPHALLKYDDTKVDALMQDAGIIRHRAKVEAVIRNAEAYFQIKELYGSLDSFLWSYVNNAPIRNEQFEFKTRSETSDKLSKDLKKLGFKFVGSTIIYSFMQAVGMVNDHEDDCAFQ